jgi:Asp-tRNA(Asn)/Glu-tRNA(Gln) amidotransferase A subunit family amidase
MMSDLTKLGPMGLNALTASEAAAGLESGRFTSEALVRDCLARIASREPDVLAWDYLDPDYAIEQARALDATPRRGPLHGVPVGIKDIFDTEDMPTAHGFPPYEGMRSGRDANCVAALRAAGMVILGKTATTQFACSVPRRTRNPHDPGRTPGVSSSGSAAAVADFMVPLANGSQTGGSVIGPAANCGVYGFKASLEGIDRGGFRHCKPSIDTIGLFARSMEDLILLRSVQTGENAAAPVEREAMVRVGVVRTAAWDEAEPAMRAAVERTADLLARAGALVGGLELPARFTEIVPDFSIQNGWEAARALETEIRDHLDAFNALNRERVEFVRGLTEEDYARACRNLNAARAEMNALFDDRDVFLSPSLQGEAPVGLDKVHPGVFARLWTQMHTPAVNLPLYSGPNGLPICFQVIGPKGRDGATLAFADWIDKRLREALGSVPAAA